ncbi:hypothetical protein JQ543_02545 [Bradyrhizobium diazoefficiens]|nr:hypothetical protein [Bradyrhizobium diazoefficiens]MBR0774433.1 hypothetical protein [Bradyrhizobium diazoefficiens]MBR0846609.1 hypothetical protein [Bradyrhizobium diazoefficiens]
MPLHACPNLRRSVRPQRARGLDGSLATASLLKAWDMADPEGSYMAADMVLKLAVIALFLFSAVLASMLWLSV